MNLHVLFWLLSFLQTPMIKAISIAPRHTLRHPLSSPPVDLNITTTSTLPSTMRQSSKYSLPNIDQEVRDHFPLAKSAMYNEEKKLNEPEENKLRNVLAGFGRKDRNTNTTTEKHKKGQGNINFQNASLSQPNKSLVRSNKNVSIKTRPNEHPMHNISQAAETASRKRTGLVKGVHDTNQQINSSVSQTTQQRNNVLPETTQQANNSLSKTATTDMHKKFVDCGQRKTCSILSEQYRASISNESPSSGKDKWTKEENDLGETKHDALTEGDGGKRKEDSVQATGETQKESRWRQTEVTEDAQTTPGQETMGHPSSGLHGRPQKKIFCYYSSSANARPGVGKFWPEHIDPFLCTHVIFAFADITKDGKGIKNNNWNDLGPSGLYARTTRLKEKNPELKVLLAVGGWKMGSKPFITLMQRDSYHEWSHNVLAYLRKYAFDGLDMDWEFPATRGSSSDHKYKFTKLMKTLYETFAEETAESGQDKLLLTLAAASSDFYVQQSYEAEIIHKYVDYMLLMTYNYHGSGWEMTTGHHSPTLPHRSDPPVDQRELYMLWSVDYWLQKGVPKSKLVVGLATFGMGWTLADPDDHGVRAPTTRANTAGRYTGESGILALFEICEKVLKEQWRVEWIMDQRVPYVHGQQQWVGFDSPDSISLKTKVILKLDLAGAFVWSVEMDDFAGHCGGPKFPIIRTVYNLFTGANGAEIMAPGELKIRKGASHDAEGGPGDSRLISSGWKSTQGQDLSVDSSGRDASVNRHASSGGNAGSSSDSNGWPGSHEPSGSSSTAHGSAGLPDLSHGMWYASSEQDGDHSSMISSDDSESWTSGGHHDSRTSSSDHAPWTSDGDHESWTSDDDHRDSQWEAAADRNHHHNEHRLGGDDVGHDTQHIEYMESDHGSSSANDHEGQLDYDLGDDYVDVSHAAVWNGNYESDQESDHGEDTGSDHGEDTGSDYGEDTGSDYGEDAGSEYGEDTGSDHEEDSGSDHGEDSGSDHGEDAGSEYGEDTGSDHGEDTGSDYGEDIRSDYGEDTGSDYGEDTGSDHGEDTGSDHGEDTGSDHGEDTGSDSGEDTGSDYGEDTRSDYWDDTENDYGEDEGGDYEEDTGSHYEEDTGSHYEADTGSHYEEDTGSHYEEDTGSHYEEDTGSHYEEDTGSHYGEPVQRDYGEDGGTDYGADRHNSHGNDEISSHEEDRGHDFGGDQQTGHGEDDTHDNSEDEGSDGASHRWENHPWTPESNDDYQQPEEGSLDCYKYGLGIWGDDESCVHFNFCVPAFPVGLRALRMVCPEGTRFDRHLKVCNHAHEVPC